MTEQDIDPAVPDVDGGIDGDIDGEPAAEDRVEALERELEQTRAAHQRAVADYQNLERRSREERAEVSRLALAGAVAGFLPVLDDLERAIESAPDADAGGDASWMEGVRLVAQKFTQVLAAHGVEEVPALMQPFDPMRHEAVGSAPGPEGTVVHLLRRGYTLRGQVVRPAMVMVGSGDGDDASTGGPATTDESDH